jgi:hypothetical protein
LRLQSENNNPTHSDNFGAIEQSRDLTSLAKSNKVDETENKEEKKSDFNRICDSLILTLRSRTAYFVADNFEPVDKTLCS